MMSLMLYSNILYTVLVRKYIAGIYWTALSWDIHSYVEVGYAGRLCPANYYNEVYSWDILDGSVLGHS